jgi:hypothetical protein
MGLGRSPLRYNNRRMAWLVCCLHPLMVEWRSAAVAEDRLAMRVWSSAGRTFCVPEDRFLFKCGTAAGAEARLVVDGRAAAAAAYDRHRRDSCTAPVTELRQFVGNNRAAPGADRECGLFLFGHGSTAPVAELRLVIERRVAAFTTGFCHILPLVDKTGRSINTLMLFRHAYKKALFRYLSLQKNSLTIFLTYLFCFPLLKGA